MENSSFLGTKIASMGSALRKTPRQGLMNIKKDLMMQIDYMNHFFVTAFDIALNKIIRVRKFSAAVSSK